MGWIIGYIFIAAVTALGISALSERAAQWGAKRCMVLGAFWPISLIIIGFTIGYDKLINRRK